jgi:small subunit ribosomal protein S7
MSRASKTERKKLSKPDSSYHSPLVARFINKVMAQGKKSIAQRIVYLALASASENKKDALEILKKAMDEVTPKMEVRARRVGGATYQVPGPVRHDRAESLAIRWILTSARARKGVPMYKKLSLELKDAASGIGNAVKKRETMHKMAEANRAFAHFRW